MSVVRSALSFFLVLCPGTLVAQEASDTAFLGIVTDAQTARAVAGAVVEVNGLRRTETDSLGRFSFSDLSPGRIEVRVWRLGYAPADTVLALGAGERTLLIALEPRALELRPLTVHAEKDGAARERALFDREPRPGVVGVSREELQAVPALAEADVLRSLQALPGVVQLNDLSARLHVRGGGPDQNLFLLDGARIFAPYHLFGIFGAVNADAVGRVEFYRGSLPARYGGVLSSVVDMTQRRGGEDLDVVAGLSLLGARGTATGRLPWARGEWLLAARRTHADLAARLRGREFPYAFHDFQGSLSLEPRRGQRLRGSFFASSDRFRLFLDGTSPDLHSTWENAVGSLRWDAAGAGPWSLAASLHGSIYGGALDVGSGVEPATTTNAVGAGGLRVEAVRQGERTGIRFGIDLERGAVELRGSDRPGGYVTGRTTGEYFQAGAYVEAEQWLGPLRLAPGLRAVHRPAAGRSFLEPRLAGRVHLTDDLALSFGAGRSHQLLSTLRDDRYPLPGAPFWLLHPEGAPASRTDGASAALEGWVGRAWSFSVGGFARRFDDALRWRPIGVRDVSGLEFDDGGAHGAELMVRRHAGRLTGWVGYGYSRARLEERETGIAYLAPWDRTHAIDLALFARVWRELELSGRLVFGTGLPFWPQAGVLVGHGFDPLRGAIWSRLAVPVWATEQMRFPDYFRFDLAAGYAFRAGRFDIEPVLSLSNVTGRKNVLHYSFPSPTYAVAGPGLGPVEEDVRLFPEMPFPLPVLPSFGLEVRF